MEHFEPCLQPLAMRLGIAFNTNGYPCVLPPSYVQNSYDVDVMAVAMRIENLLRFEDVDRRRQALTEVAEDIDEWLQILGENDHRVAILWAMHAVATAIVDGSRVPTEDELGLPHEEEP